MTSPDGITWTGRTSADFDTRWNAVVAVNTIESTTTFYNGEIYELLVFAESLYDIDNTGGLITQIYNNQFSLYGA